MDTVCKVPSQAKQSCERNVADELIDDLIRACPAHRPGTRPIHAPGIAALGWFSATPVASTLTTAAHFAGGRVPVTVRFSNGTGDISQPDTLVVVRGMAVKFHLPPVTEGEGGVMHSAVETDLISASVPMLPVKTIAGVREFVRATTPTLPKVRSRWQRLIEKVRLDTPYPAPPPGTPSDEQAAYDFAVKHPEATPAVAYPGVRFVPESYTTCSYHAIHAFALTAPDRSTRWVRFHWEPVDGVHAAAPGARGNFLRGGLKERIASGHAEFVLRVQLAELGDDPADPSRLWPARRPRVVMGHLRLTAVPEDQRHWGEHLSFNPCRTVPGVGLSPDPLLAVRGEVYRRSAARRSPSSPGTAQAVQR